MANNNNLESVWNREKFNPVARYRGYEICFCRIENGYNVVAFDSQGVAVFQMQGRTALDILMSKVQRDIDTTVISYNLPDFSEGATRQ